MSSSKSSASEASKQSSAAAPGVGVIDFGSLPAGTTVETLSFRAADGVGSRGVLYTRGGERSVVCISHPRGDVSQHYAIPYLLEAGYAAYAHQCRGLNNDVDCEHEKLMFDLAAGFTYLKENRDYERLILLGNSGGGSLFAFYQQQANTPPPGRLTDTAAGEPCDLNALAMPRADAIILLAAHGGEGRFMLDGIDPSIVDENDPLSVDPSLDMYDPANGFRLPPEPSSYSAEFLERYRAGQRARVARLDARARNWIAEQDRYKKLMALPTYRDLPPEEQIYIARRATVGRYLVIYRTEANPAYCDLSLHAWKSTRKVGSIIGGHPERINYEPGGFARYLTPRAWLSSWSGLSSRADLLTSIKSILEPTLMLSYSGDNGCSPEANREQLDASPSSDKAMELVPADHYGRPLTERARAMSIMVGWLRERMPVAARAA
jgi:hypothetical protein